MLKETIDQLLPGTAARLPDKPALIFADRTLTFRELERLTNKAANGFKALGVGKGDRVTLFAQNSPEWVISYAGIAKAGAKSTRTAREGTIATYIHHNHQLGVLLELNSESDFVARNDEFRHLAHEIAVHIAAAEPQYLRREDVPKDVLDRERAIFEAQASEQKKPPQVIEKIVQGKLNDFYKREVLLDQPFAKDDKRTVDQMLKEGIAKLGENITISRFARFKVGEAS